MSHERKRTLPTTPLGTQDDAEFLCDECCAGVLRRREEYLTKIQQSEGFLSFVAADGSPETKRKYLGEFVGSKNNAH
jgi:hypothetical protein